MNHLSVISALVLVLFGGTLCQADTLVITYRSGKTQTVVLDESSQGITSWQFVGGTVSQQQPKNAVEAPAPAKQEQINKFESLAPATNQTNVEKSTEKKSGIRVNWNSKPVRD